MFSKSFWIQTAERSLKTGAQAIILGLGLGEGFNAFAMDWGLAGGFFLGGVILSVLTSMVSANVGANRGSPSLVDTPQ